MTKKIIAILLARGGSKGIPKKNIINFCGKPLISWSIEEAKKIKKIPSIWVSSDNQKILSIAEKYGAKSILLPKSLSTDNSTSASGFLHAIDYIEKTTGPIDTIIALQATSPLRTDSDIKKGLRIFEKENLDSLFSSMAAGDHYLWSKKHGKLSSITYNFHNRKRRQDSPERFLENGSFYIFKTSLLRKTKNFLGGKIGTVTMENWKSFQIDTFDDLYFCELIMKKYLLSKK